MAKSVTQRNPVDSGWPRAIGVLVVLATLWYLPWALAHLNRQALWLSLPFAVASVMTAVTTIVTVINHWHHRVPVEHVVPSGAEPTVAVIIPTYGEPAWMLYETGRSVLEQDYPRDRIRLVISDDAHREGIRLAVQSLQGEHPGASIFYHEPPRRGDPHRRGEAKAGNLNSVLDALQVYAPGVEFVETRDADDKVGDRAFLRRVVGQLQADPTVAYVQTIKEAVTSTADPFGNLEPLFYRRAMLARHAVNAVFPCGSGLVWRVAALNDIGGFPSWNLVEDLQSGLEALKRGWRGVYLPIVGAVAQTAPEDMPNAIKQRGTWALDTLRLMFWGERRGLNLAQRLQFAELGLFYLVSFAAFVFAVTPAFSLFFDIHPLTTTEAQWAWHFWPYAIAIELLLVSLAWGLPYESLWRSRQMWLGMMPVYMRATLLALRFGPARKPSYRVTRKDQVYAWYWRAVLPQLALLVLLLAGIAYQAVTRPLLTEADLGSMFWAGFFVLGLSRIVRNSWHAVPVRERLLALLRPLPAGQRVSTFRRSPPFWVPAATAMILLGLSLPWAYLRWWKPVTLRQAEQRRLELSSQAAWDLATGNYAAAESALRALLAANPADEQVQRRLADVQRRAALSASYAAIQEAIAQENWSQTDLLLVKLKEQGADDETVQALDALRQARQAQSALFQWAETAYRTGEWTTAASAYQMLQGWDSTYQGQTVTQHLADSYVYEGINLVESTRGETGAVQQAIQLYRKALLLRPGHERAVRELDLAEKYLQGRELLAQNDLAGALRAWEPVYQQDPTFAGSGLAVFFRFMGTEATPPAAGASPGGN